MKIFLLADTSIKMVLKISFLFFNNIDIKFKVEGLIQMKYIIVKTLLTIYQIELIDKKVFAKTVLYKTLEIFVIYITILKIFKMTIDFFYADHVWLKVTQQAIL